MSKQYTWNFDGDAELWQNDIFNSVEECIEDAKSYGDYESVFVAEVIPYSANFGFGYYYIDKATEDAYFEVGEASENWLTDISLDEEKLLDKYLNEAFIKWMKEVHQEPYFYKVDNIKKYSLEEDTDNDE